MTARILVIEDNPKNLKLVHDVLEHAGFDVVEARTGEEGIEAASRCAPDLVLMDLQLPGIDGNETLRELRKSGHRRVPVVAVTAFAMHADRERVLAEGFDGYLEKPISVRTFPSQIREFLQGEETS
jgi:two-component system cell cycle response regulator DivK